MIKWIVCDMDGTILNEDNQIMPLTKQKLIEYQKSGIRLVLASGRGHNKMIEYANELEMNQYHGIMIQVNGLSTFEFETQRRSKKEILYRKDIELFFEYAKKYDVEMIAMQDDVTYDYFSDTIKSIKEEYRNVNNIDDSTSWQGGYKKWVVSRSLARQNSVGVKNVEDFPNEVNKICFCHDEAVIQACYRDIKDHYDDEYEIVRTSHRWLEFMAKGVTKGNALAEVMKKYHIEKDEIIAFGDGENDCSIFEIITYGMAMGNGMDVLKNMAFDICEDNQHEGIAKMLKKYEHLLSNN